MDGIGTRRRGVARVQSGGSSIRFRDGGLLSNTPTGTREVVDVGGRWSLPGPLLAILDNPVPHPRILRRPAIPPSRRAIVGCRQGLRRVSAFSVSGSLL